MGDPAFEDLLAEGASVPVEGWDFSWFEGRATEERPSWGYAAMLAGRAEQAKSMLDVETGGGEVFHWVLSQAGQIPGRAAATESWPPNAAIAAHRLRPIGASVVRASDEQVLPFRSGSFDLVSSRHPVVTVWNEIARVLRPGGTFLSQQVGPGTNRELAEFLLGPRPISPARAPSVAKERATEAGLEVVDLRAESLEVVFFDVAAVVYFLRKVPWTVPDFAVERFQDRLADLHHHIERHGRFVSHAERYLIEARKPR